MVRRHTHAHILKTIIRLLFQIMNENIQSAEMNADFEYFHNVLFVFTAGNEPCSFTIKNSSKEDKLLLYKVKFIVCFTCL